MTLLDCPRPDCGAPLEQVLAKDGTDDEGEVMHVYCPRCRWELVDPELGDAEVAP